MIRKFTLLIATLLTSAAMQASFAPQVSEYFITQDADFDVDYDRKIVEYDFTLRARKPLPKGSLIEVRFQKPNTKSDFFTREHIVKGDEREIIFTSGHVNGLKLKKDYKIEVTLFESAVRGRVLSEHDQRLFFEMKKKKYKERVKDWYEKGSRIAKSNSDGSSSSGSASLRLDPRFRHRQR